MTSNIILEEGRTKELTIATDKVEEIRRKTLAVIDPAQPSNNWSSGPKDSKIVDLLRVRHLYNIDGEIDSGDRTKFWNIFNAGGVFKLKYNGINYNVNFEKAAVTESPVDAGGAGDTDTEPETYTVKFSVVVGENI